MGAISVITVDIIVGMIAIVGNRVYTIVGIIVILGGVIGIMVGLTDIIVGTVDVIVGNSKLRCDLYNRYNSTEQA